SANWGGDPVPTSADTVTFAGNGGAAAYTVTIDTTINPTVQSVTFSSGGGLVTLVVGAQTLTVSNPTSNLATAISMNANAKLTLAGGIINVTNGGGITTATGSTISGAGTVAASATNGVSGSGVITATGGTLELNAGLTGTTALTITGANDTLKLDKASAATSLSFGSTGTVVLNTAASSLTLTSALSVGGATISMLGGTLTDSAGVTLGTGSHLTGFGTFNPTFTGTNAGTITASGGTLALASNIAASSGLTFNVFDSTASVLKLNGTVGATNTFNFSGTHGALELNDVTITPSGLHFAGAVKGLDVAASATPDLSTVNYVNVQATITNAVLTNSTHIELFSGATDLGTITLATATTATHVDWFADSGHQGSIIGSGTDIILSNVVCFALGTHIQTATGEQAVESLEAGDIVLTVSGDQLEPRSVKWVGRRRIDLTTHPLPDTVRPVRIQRGALAENTPHRDLIVSPDHAIFVDGKLICARQLINGSTIRQERSWTAVEYFHVELDAHAILLAEGLPAESYLNTGNRGFFANSGEPLILHPDLTDESDNPTREAGSCAPFVSDEASVLPVWQKLADRAAALGTPAAMPETTADAALQLAFQDRRIRPIFNDGKLAIFPLPRAASQVRLVSRTAAPADARPWLDDRRQLGVRVTRLVVRSSGDLRDIALDGPDLKQGWWEVERDGNVMGRWTEGDAMLTLPTQTGPRMLEVHIGQDLTYPVESPAEEARKAAVA
ncbi:MAG TPA: Hint domain-containing protein, partial [Acetobacteraceae bacterium]|nr:Hint domain-containing protein [Acetobacteraceae bacterium]